MREEILAEHEKASDDSSCQLPDQGFRRMLDRLSALAHGLWVCIKSLLHSFQGGISRECPASS